MTEFRPGRFEILPVIIKNLLINMLAKREQWLPLIIPIKKNKNLKI